MSHIMVISVALGLVGPFLESKFDIAAKLGLDEAGPSGLSKAFGLTPILVAGLTFWCLMHGFMVVGEGRKKYTELAKKDNEKEVEARYGLPNLYAQGTSKHVQAFNCIQRSHQQIFETFPQTAILSLVGAVHYPVTAAMSMAAYAIGRVALTNGYVNADGDASKRYASPFAVWMWYGTISTIAIAAVSSVSFLTGGPVL